MNDCTHSDAGQVWEMTMSGVSEADTRPSKLASLAGIGLSAVGAVWAVALLVVCGGALATCWRMMDLHERQQQAQLKATRQFHVNLIDQMQLLVGHSAASVTDDLCRVRFRLRLPHAESPPAGTYHVDLQRSPDDGGRVLDSRGLPRAGRQVADFGMLSPGAYRLTIEDEHGMRCRHDFEVRPGVAVDRVAYCPRYRRWMFREGPSEFRLRLDWPTLWESRPIVAAVHVRNGSEVSQGWHWQPAESKQFDACLLVADDAMSSSWENICRALPASLMDTSAPLPVLPDEAGHLSIVVPYACCEIYGVSFLLATPDEADSYRHLGTFLYDDPGSPEDRSVPAHDERVIVLSRPCPRQVATGPEPAELLISLPELIVPMVRHLADASAPDGV